MYGFRISIGEQVQWDIRENKYSFVRHWTTSGIHLTQWSLRKFEKDKLWLEDDEHFVAVEGILFNRDEIVSGWQETDEHSETFATKIAQWRGSFACVVANKQTHEIQLYNDQIGSHMLFWCQTEKGIYVCSDLFELSHAIGLHEINTAFMHRILKSGYGNNEQTMVKGIYRIGAGQVLTIKDGKAEVSNYYRFDNKPLHTNEDEALARTNELFRQAVKRIIDKNEEYGLRHFYPLSGGLDSRMVQTIARQLTTQPITNFTYSQTNHYDHLLPEKIANYLGNEWCFLPLDGGIYLAKVDEITHATQGLVNYNGPSEIYYCSTQFGWTDAGVVATGVNGDNIFSVETDSKHEIERLYSLSFAGNGLGSPLVLQQYTETYSPFCDVDVLNYVLHIPLRKRWNYHFYDQWILRYYPEAAQWDHKGEQIGHRRIVLPIMGRNIPLKDLAKRMTFFILKRLHIYNGYQMEEGISMTPYDTWVRTNPELHKAIDSYYQAGKHLLAPYPEIQKEAETIMREGRVYDQCAVLTILSTIRQCQ